MSLKNEPHDRANDRPQQSRWRDVLAVFVVFLAGPIIVTAFWAADVFVFNSSGYINSFERNEILVAILPLGTGVSVFVSLVVAFWLLSRR